ncbi:ferritin [Methanogenium organophilum]|uniref:Ferritin n=1 Tax=Methanogenium organophilum TaxID=2199 RepID=A0A9X9S3D5_METOG|nr:ferritin [Methanogenium organophilum]WAI00765.1 ferritin [Methanogenium organophilum]
MSSVDVIRGDEMMNQRILETINEQIKWELYSSYLYLSMSAWYDSIGLRGFANWERIQAMEERDHALKFYDYVLARGGVIELQSIDAPPSSWESPEKAFEFQYAHEQSVTAKINNLVEIALEERDHATYNMLQYFVDEQVEEEDNAHTVLEQLRMVSDEAGKSILFMIDKDLAARVYNPPVTQAE